MTPEERFDTRAAMPVWWPMPTENTIDRATTVLPGLLYDRMDEIGLDFSIVYPGTGLLVVTLPGMADDDLRARPRPVRTTSTTPRCSPASTTG